MSNKGKMRVNGIQCPRCDEKFYSAYRHDFRYCGCGYCFIDGGQEDYIRTGWGVGLPDGMQNDGTVPKEVWEKVNEETRKIGQPKHITMYVDRPKQKYVEKELNRLNKLIDKNIKEMSKPRMELPDELPKQRNRKQATSLRSKSKRSKRGSRKSSSRR